MSDRGDRGGRGGKTYSAKPASFEYPHCLNDQAGERQVRAPKDEKEQGVVVVGLCADRIECSSVEVAKLFNELIAEVGALLVLLVIVKVDLPLVSRCIIVMLFNRSLPEPTRRDRTKSQVSALHLPPSVPFLQRAELKHSEEADPQGLASLGCWRWGKRCGWL